MKEKSLFQRIFTPMLLIVLAYEWLISGLEKIFNEHFFSQFNQQLLIDMNDMQYTFYLNILKRIILPHTDIFAVFVEISEICVGVAFAMIAAALVKNRLNNGMIQLGIWTGILSAVMVLNIFLIKGGSIFFNTRNSFEGGIHITFILFLMQLFITVIFFFLQRKQMLSKRT